jgi:hypothetical protein
MVLALMGAGFGMEIGKLGIIRNTVIKYSKLVNTHPALPLIEQMKVCFAVISSDG